MSQFRIKAYFMHEHERAAAEDAEKSQIIQNAEWTPGYVMGVVDQAKLKGLTKQGLVVSVIEELAPAANVRTEVTANLPIASAPATFSMAKSQKRSRGATMPAIPTVVAEPRPQDRVISRDSRRSQFYVVRFNGPITAARRQELTKLGIKLQERITRNKYTIRLKPSEVDVLAQLPFVDTIRLYTTEDTLRSKDASDKPPKSSPQPKATAARPKTGCRRARIYAVRLHRAQDMPAIVRWLKRKNRKPLFRSKDSLRVVLDENSKTLTELAARSEVAVVESVATPRTLDDHARRLIRLEVAGKNPIDCEGAGELIGIADTGIDVAHPDFKGRIHGTRAWGRPGNVTDPAGHGTHVAGCAAGDGTASKGLICGAAPKAKIFFQSILDAAGELGGLPADLTQLFQEAYAEGVRIHNNSWGAFNYARYSVTSQDVDRFVAANPDMLIVIAAGNDGIGTPRVAGGTVNANKGFVDWPCVAAPATAKNGLTVGASRNSRTSGGYAALTWGDAWDTRYPHPPIATQKISGDDSCLAAFSSRGPCDDSRVKPDLVAPGTDIAAARSRDAPLHKFWGAYPKNKSYGFMGGTSMAAPYVAGCAAIAREWIQKKAKWPTPSAALLKAVLINGTQRIDGACAVAPITGDPNYHQGFGRIDMAQSLPNPSAPKLKLEFADSWKLSTTAFKKTGDIFRYELKVGAGEQLRVCLTWTDPPARGLQNSLVLMLDDSTGQKWVGNSGAAALLPVSGGPRDPNNNVQVIRISKPKAGTYTIAIVAGMLLISPQTFALVVTGELASPLKPI